MKRPARAAKCSRMTPDSNTASGPPSASWSTIAGRRLLGLIAKKPGSNWSLRPIFTGIMRYARPHSSSMIEIFQPFGVGQ